MPTGRGGSRGRPHAAALRALLANPKLPAVDRRRVVRTVLPAYRAWRHAAGTDPTGTDPTGTDPAVADPLGAALARLEHYSRVVELELIYDSPEPFLPRQAGQLKLVSSLLEEFLPTLVTRTVLGCDPGPVAVGPARTLAGFRVGGDGRVRLTVKDQDFAVTRTLGLDATGAGGRQRLAAAVPLVAVETKVNLDATMWNEARANASALKAVAPDAAYFVVCDWLDMTPRPSAGTGIDNVLILRGRRPALRDRLPALDAAGRQARRAEYAEHLQQHPRRAAPLAPLLTALADRLADRADTGAGGTDAVVAAGVF